MRLSLYLIAFLLYTSLSAQIVRDSSHISFAFTPSNKEHKFQIYFNNTADTAVNVNWILTKNSRAWVDCWDTNFCDINLCYADNIDSSSFENFILPGEFFFELGIKDNNCGGSALLGLQLFTDADFQNEIYCMSINVNESTSDINYCTSSTNDEWLSDIKIYPNPTSQYLHVEGEDIKSIDIFNILGNPVQSLDFNNSNIVDVASLSSGLYMLRVTSQKNQTQVYKFFKQ